MSWGGCSLARRGNKFHAVPAEWEGRRYASTAERDYRAVLAWREMAGEVRNIEEQPRVELEPGIFYKPDFQLEEKNGSGGWRLAYHEVKGMETERFRLICKLWRLHGKAPLRVVKRAGRRAHFCTVREIYPEGEETC